MQEPKATNPVLAHLRANLWLLFLTVVICCVLYPLAVWAVGQALFHDQARGSLIYQKVDGKDVAVGSALIAQPFNSPVYFRPRPSAVSYNAAASGGSNLGASNPKLRGRVAQLLGTIARYTEAYKQAHPRDDGGERNPQDDIREWAKEHKGKVKPDIEEADVPSACFDAWLTEQVRAKKLDPLKDFDQVPADLVTTSGSGLDPDISLANAKYQEVGVVAANRDAIVAAYEKAKDAKATDAQKAKVEKDVKASVDGLLNDMASRPMLGLTGDVPVVNVLRLNLALKEKIKGVKVD